MNIIVAMGLVVVLVLVPLMGVSCGSDGNGYGDGGDLILKHLYQH